MKTHTQTCVEVVRSHVWLQRYGQTMCIQTRHFPMEHRCPPYPCSIEFSFVFRSLFPKIRLALWNGPRCVLRLLRCIRSSAKIRRAYRIRLPIMADSEASVSVWRRDWRWHIDKCSSSTNVNTEYPILRWSFPYFDIWNRQSRQQRWMGE